ncbi:MAG: 16S rRNA (cytosine(967)-C(5))-methyltransferase RsmB [Myxococcota bacterium]|nr:16S rRNA (cytosine(967)-C(5))-methyltransferase RsmB [Myxococcota bacterium]
MRERRRQGDARAVALKVLARIEAHGAFAQQALEAECAKAGLDRRDQRLAWTLVLGVERWRRRLDDVLKPRIRRGFDRLDPVVHRILRLAVFQLQFLDRIPPRAALNTSAELARTYVGEWAVSFVNGVLRAVLRSKYEPPVGDSPEKISVALSHPQWLVERYYARFGAQGTRARCAANNAEAPLTVRPTAAEFNRHDLMDDLIDEGARVSLTERSDHGIIIEYHPDPFGSAAFVDGRWVAQDEASQLTVELLDPQPGESVWDVCAAPGGKTRYIAQRMGNQGLVLATDVDAQKVEQLVHTVPETCVMVRQHDATKRLEGHGTFDRVLLDAPCTALGLLRRHPEIRWRRTIQDIERCARQQRVLLATVSDYVKPGGILVYSVCTDFEEEGASQIAEFLSERRDFRLMGPDEESKKWRGVVQDGLVTLSPEKHGTDGFFMARLQRVEVNS